ncbi:Mediator of RNA polymerase II transcription subunit 31 [Dirofilaria immitis]|nr:Mediator of RNA polymerase II transcription subunit 31 [Dirofilaria immitis]
MRNQNNMLVILCREKFFVFRTMERCSYILKKKNRKCRMLVKSGQKYCGEHAICDELNKDRIICPNDPKHTVNKSQLQKHLSSRCNSRLFKKPWIIKNFNLTGFSNEVELWYRPADDELLRMGKIVERIYDQIANNIADSFLKNDYVENYAAEHVRIADLLNNHKRWCMIEFGAGKAQLSYWMAKIAPKCRFLLIEKKGSRNKFDNKILMELDGVFLERLRCSVEHLDLSKIDFIRNVDNIVAVCKHFCGVATDFGIRCLMNGVKSGLNICGFVLAPCCYHKITYEQYVGQAFLKSHGICSSDEFAALRHISTWAVCGFPGREFGSAGNSVGIHVFGFSEKKLLGRKAKAVLEFGRVIELQKFGYDVSLHRHVEEAVSPENFLIVGKKLCLRNFERVSNLDLLRGEVSCEMCSKLGCLVICMILLPFKKIVEGSGLNSVQGPETSEEQKKRFEIECEFVQALANPHYLNFLAQRGYFKETYFINYLKYLLYWKRPEYARALKYPQCLHFLEAVQSPSFREAITCTANAKFIEEQQLLQWQYYTRKRQRLHMYTTEHDDDEQEWKQQPQQRQKLQQHPPNFFLHSLCFVIIAEQTADLPSLCESCVLFAREFGEQLISAVERELKFVEALEELVSECYNINCTRKNQTFHDLPRRKVELGIPYEMWNSPSVEIVTLKQNCETLLEHYENDLEQWYHIRDRPLLETEHGCMDASNNLEL